MRSFMRPARKAEAVRRGLAAFFVAAGALAIYATSSVLSPAIGLMLGFPSMVLGAGIWRYWGLARWAALGACFLLVVGAFAIPLVVSGALDDVETDNPARLEWFSWCVAGAIGLLGYWGLQYFRSPAAREAFARSADIRIAFERESPSIVVTSTLVLLVAWVLPVALVWSGESKSVDAANRPPSRKSYPDLVATGICLRGSSLVQAVIANRGQSGSDRKFIISYSGLRLAGSGSGTSTARVPPAGTSGLVGLDRATGLYESDSENLEVRVTVDSGKQVDESDEGNNHATFPVVFRYSHPGNLQPCPKLPEMNGQ